jgi:hypothetical protein
MEHGIDDMVCTGPPYRRCGGCNLAPEETSVCPGNDAGPVDQDFHLGRDVEEVDRRVGDDPVGRDHPLAAIVEDIVVEDAPPVRVLETAPAVRASADRPPADPDEFRGDALVLEFAKDVPAGRGPVIARGRAGSG